MKRYLRLFTSDRGFTLLEVMVAFTLLSLVSGVGIVSFIQYNRTQEVNQASRDVSLFIERARANTSSFVKPSVCGASTLQGYSVTYCAQGDCEGDVDYEMSVLCGGQQHVVDTLTLSPNISVAPGSTCTSIIFRLPHGTAQGSVPCTQRLLRGSYEEIITVDNVGNVVFGADALAIVNLTPTIAATTTAPTPTQGAVSTPTSAQPTPTTTQSGVTIDRTVTTGSGDGYWTANGVFSGDSTVLHFGWLNSTNQSTNSFARFTNITIPKGAVIQNAYMTFTGVSGANQTVNLRIQGINADNAAAPTSYASAEGAARTSAFANWSNVPAFVSTVPVNTPNISSVIQAIVNRPGWVSGNSIVLYVEDLSSTQAQGTSRAAYSYNAVPANAPRLFVQYGAAAPTPTAVPPTPTSAAPTPTAVPPTPTTVQTITYSQFVRSSTDDGYWALGGSVFNNNSSVLYFGYFNATNRQINTFARFNSVTVPKGKVITEATLTFKGVAISGNTVNVRIRAVDADNPNPPTNYSAAASAVRTSAFVDWLSVPLFSSGVYYTTPNIAPVIQEIVNRAGWASGNSMVLYVEELSSTQTGAYRASNSYTTTLTNNPRLIIKYVP